MSGEQIWFPHVPGKFSMMPEMAAPSASEIRPESTEVRSGPDFINAESNSTTGLATFGGPLVSCPLDLSWGYSTR